MNKKRIFLGLLLIAHLLNSCCSTGVTRFFTQACYCTSDTEDCCYASSKVKITIYFINETSDEVVLCDNNVAPNATLKFTETYNIGYDSCLLPDGFTVDNTPFVYSCSLPKYKDGVNFRCDKGAIRVENYEDRKELTPEEYTRVFELTYRFTEEKKAAAESCN